MNRLLPAFAVVSVVVLSGCATPIPKQEFNAEASSHIQKVAFTRYEEQKEIGVVVVAHAGASFGLIGAAIAAADMNSKTTKLTAALDVGKLQPASTFNDQLQTALAAQGYAITPVDLGREASEVDVKAKLANMGTKDASLIVRSDAGFVAAGSSSDYLPSVKARAELLDGKGDKVLYREFFAYGFNGQTAKDTVNLTAAPECRFPDFDALLSQPDLARKCLATGVEAVAKAIANDLKR